MPNKVQDELRAYRTAYGDLQSSFRNNLNVIKELQDENQTLQAQCQNLHVQLQHVIEKYEKQLQEKLINEKQEGERNLNEMEKNYQREIHLLREQYQQVITELQNNNQNNEKQLLQSVVKKHKKEVQAFRTGFERQIQDKDKIIQKLDKKIRTFQTDRTNQQQRNKQATLKILSLESELESALRSRKQAEQLFRQYEEQLETLKNSNNSWEALLKTRIKELEGQKNSLEEELTEMKYLNKEKLRKMKEEGNKKLTQQQEQHAQKILELGRQARQIKFRFDSIKSENAELRLELDPLKKRNTEALQEIQQLKSKIGNLQNDISKTRQLQFELRSAKEDKKKLQNQIIFLQNEKQTIRNQYNEVNTQREHAEKALERLKVELLNKSRESEQLRKQIQKIKYQQKLVQNPPMSGQKQIAQKLQNYDKKDRVKGQVQYSQCFTEDMGPIDSNFFSIHNQAKQYSLQKPQVHYNNEQPDSPRQPFSSGAGMMKRISELQLENNEYKETINRLRKDMESTSLLVEQKISLKDRQLKLSRQENMLLRERINDKDSNILNLNESLRKIVSQLQYEKKQKTKDQHTNQICQKLKMQNSSLTQQNRCLKEKIKELEEEVEIVGKERETLEDIADELRMEVNCLQQEYQNFQLRYSSHQPTMQNPSAFSNISGKPSISHQSRRPIHSISQHQMPRQKIVQGDNTSKNLQKEFKKSSQQQTRKNSKSPSKTATNPRRVKLHQLIRQKNKIQQKSLQQRPQFQGQQPLIEGRRAIFEMRPQNERFEHRGTQSQKQVYQKIKRTNSKSKEKQQGIVYNLSQLRQKEEKYRQSNVKLIENQMRKLPQKQIKGGVDGQSPKHNKIVQVPRKEKMIDSLLAESLQNVSMSYWNN